MIVMKFGGTSVGSADRIKALAEIVSSYKDRNPIIVLSAVSGVTDKLIEAAQTACSRGAINMEEIEKKHRDILSELKLDKSLVDKELNELKETLDAITKSKDNSNKAIDDVSSFGERMSSRIVAGYFNSINLRAKNFDAWDVGFITDSNFGAADLLPDSENKIKENLSNVDSISVITGFIGKNEHGQITTLGRGGSDYTAAIIGAVLDAEEIQIWTDVDGMMTSDPRIVKEAKTIPIISFNEAAELATFGAKVLHPKTIHPAIKKSIPVKVLNSFNPDAKGTTIVKDCENCKGIVRAISLKKNITLFNITSTRMLLAYGFLARLFDVFYKYKVPVDMVATSEVSVSLTVDSANNVKDLENIQKELSGIGDVNVEKDKSIICLVGIGMKNTPGVASRIFNTIGQNNINIEMISQGASEINIGFIVDEKDAEKAVQCLHKEFFS